MTTQQEFALPYEKETIVHENPRSIFFQLLPKIVFLEETQTRRNFH